MEIKEKNRQKKYWRNTASNIDATSKMTTSRYFRNSFVFLTVSGHSYYRIINHDIRFCYAKKC